MSATARQPRPVPPPVRIRLPLPRRFLRCIACGTVKKDRPYALCAECWRVNGTLPPAWLRRLARLAEREAEQVSYREDPRFEQAARVYARRLRRARARAAREIRLPTYRGRPARPEAEQYDGLGGHDLGDLLDGQMHGAELPPLEASGHREISEAEIARWDARVDAWAEAHGFSLADAPAPEIRPWGYAVVIDGALVWTDDPA
jgi:hypothetical protein